MLFFTALVSAVLSLTFVDPASAIPAAAPDQVFLEPSSTGDVGARACQTIYPSFIKPIFSWAPDLSIPNTVPQSRLFEVQSSGPDQSWREDSLLMFTGIPPLAYGCQLQYVFPSGFPISLYGHTQLYVYTTDRNATDSDTWRNSPKEKSQWGTANPSAGGSGVVNSEKCYEKLTYRIEIGHDSKPNAGRVSFYQTNGFSWPLAGWILTHSC
ncbi:MAG: hypothetical protein M1840_009001 [Geoglossum simile]|nr:MAG: hypothetical protein M1840_009001 [Geoglossum simile]